MWIVSVCLNLSHTSSSLADYSNVCVLVLRDSKRFYRFSLVFLPHYLLHLSFLLTLPLFRMGPLCSLPMTLGAWWGTVDSSSCGRITLGFHGHYRLCKPSKHSFSKLCVCVLSCFFPKLVDDRMALVSGISLDPEAAIGVTKKLPPKWIEGVDEVTWRLN